MSRVLICSLLACVLAAGCSGASSQPELSPDAGSPDGSVAGVRFGDANRGCGFTVTSTLTYLRDGGAVSSPELIQPTLLLLYVWESGAWQRVSQIGTHLANSVSLCDGNAIDEPFLLVDYEAHDFDDDSWAPGGVQIAGTYRGSTVIDLSHPSLTRPSESTLTPLDPATTVDVNVTGVVPTNWDSIFLYSPEVAVVADLGEPTGGSYSSQINYAQSYLPQIDAALGDTSWVVQQTSLLSDGGTSEIAVTAAAAVPGFSIIPGGNALLTANLQPVPLNHSISVITDQAAYDDAGTTMTPLGGTGYGELAVTPFPVGAGSQRVALASGSFGAPAVLDYGDLVPGMVDELYVHYGNSVRFSSGVIIDGRISSELPLDALPNPIAPVIGPARAPTINGADATVPQSGVGLTPVLSWSPPAFGQAAGYRVQLFSTDVGGGGGLLGFPIYTGETQLRLPPDYLQSGHSYGARITAFASSSRRFPELPLMKSLPDYRADFITAEFTP